MKSIQEWYKGRSVLVTGGTGYMGKVLLEKILRCLPTINKIYILIRPKRGLNPTERIKMMIKIPLFEKLLHDNPEVFKKLIPIQAELSSDNLGISEEDKNRLIDDVSVIFHMAATLRLEADVKDSLEHNTLGTLRLFELCLEFKNVESFVHLSTAFCHCDVETLEEKIYEPTKDPYKIIDMIKTLSKDIIKDIEKGLMEPHPNSYIFSKRLAEVVANDMGKKLPVSIARPSIVTPTLSEPIPGWVDSLNGPVGVLVASGKGVLRTMMCDAEANAEVCPVDIAINALIVISWIRAVKTFDVTPVYNMTTSTFIQISWRDVVEKGRKCIYEYPFEWMLWYPDGVIRKNRLVHNLTIVFCHYLPAYLIDFLLLICMQKRFMVRVQNKISLGLHLLEYFTLRKWSFKNDNVLSLESNLCVEDLETFKINSVKYDVDKYFKDAHLGSRMYCLKEDLKSVPFCKAHLKFLYYLNWMTKILLLCSLIWCVLYLLDFLHSKSRQGYTSIYH